MFLFVFWSAVQWSGFAMLVVWLRYDMIRFLFLAILCSSSRCHGAKHTGQSEDCQCHWLGALSACRTHSHAATAISSIWGKGPLSWCIVGVSICFSLWEDLETSWSRQKHQQSSECFRYYWIIPDSAAKSWGDQDSGWIPSSSLVFLPPCHINSAGNSAGLHRAGARVQQDA